MILVDTTVWIDLFAGNETPRLKNLSNQSMKEKICVSAESF